MDKFEKLNEFKKEYLGDIDAVEVSVDDLKKYKVPTSVLEAEVVLRKVFGDEIFVRKKVEENLTGEKEVVKLTEEDMFLDVQVREICDNLADANFDNNIGVLLSKVDLGDEEWKKIWWWFVMIMACHAEFQTA